jgi:hypothetical protein
MIFLSLTGGKGGVKLKNDQIKFCPFLNKKTPFLFKKGAKMSKINEKL